MSELDYSDKIEYRADAVADGIVGWWWVKTDNGAWEGPKNDWENHHKHRMIPLVKNRGVVITAGGNCGMYTRFYADLFGMVYSFEPDQINFQCLVANNPFENVVKINGALGEHNGFIFVNRDSLDNVGTHTVQQHAAGVIPMFSIDSMNFPIVDLIQLDVEGYEINIIKGAIETIKRDHPVIAGENCYPESAVGQFLQGIGYKPVEQVASDTVYVWSDE